MSTIVAFTVSVALVALFGVTKIVANGTRLDGFISVQESARQQLATELREEVAHRQGKMETLEEKVRVLTEQLDAHKAETKAAFGLVMAKELQQVEELQHEVAKPVQLTAEQISHLQAGQARIDLVVARLEGKVASVERLENMVNITERLEKNVTSLAAQANETAKQLRALAEEVGGAREESVALLATHEEMGRTLTGHDAVLKQLAHKLIPLAVTAPPTVAASRPKLAPHPKLTQLDPAAQPAAVASHPKLTPSAAAAQPATASAPHPKRTPLASTAQATASAPRPRRTPPAAAAPPAAADPPSRLTPLAATAAEQPVAAGPRPKHEPPTAAAQPTAAPPTAAPPTAAPPTAAPPTATPPTAAPPTATPPTAAPPTAAPPTAAPPTAALPTTAPPAAALPVIAAAVSTSTAFGHNTAMQAVTSTAGATQASAAVGTPHGGAPDREASRAAAPDYVGATAATAAGMEAAAATESAELAAQSH